MNTAELNNAANTWIRNYSGPTLAGRTGNARFYVGVSTRVKERLAEHLIDPDSPNCFWWPATKPQHAHEAESYMHSAGCKGGTGGVANPTTLYIYAITTTSVDH